MVAMHIIRMRLDLYMDLLCLSSVCSELRGVKKETKEREDVKTKAKRCMFMRHTGA